MADEEISIYDEIEIEDMTWDETLQIFHYPCPCGDRFEIAIDDLRDESNDIATCPSCSLMIKVIYDAVSPNRAPAHRWFRHLLLTRICSGNSRKTCAHKGAVSGARASSDRR